MKQLEQKSTFELWRTPPVYRKLCKSPISLLCLFLKMFISFTKSKTHTKVQTRIMVHYCTYLCHNACCTITAIDADFAKFVQGLAISSSRRCKKLAYHGVKITTFLYLIYLMAAIFQQSTIVCDFTHKPKIALSFQAEIILFYYRRHS